MINISLENNSSFATLLEVCNTGWITLLVSEQKADFIFYSSDLFCQCTIPCSEGEGIFRIPVTHLKIAAKEGILRVSAVEDDLTLSIFNTSGRVFYSTTMKQQVVYTEQFEHMREIAQLLGEGSSIDASSLYQLNRIASAVSGQINLDVGIASARFLGGRGFVWKEFPCSSSFAIACVNFKQLYKISKIFYSYQNYVGAMNNDIVLICKKRNVLSNFELQYLRENPQEFKARYRADVSFYNLSRFLNDIKWKDNSIVIDLENRNANVSGKGETCHVPIWVANETMSPNTKAGEIQLPKELLLGVLPFLKSKEYKLNIRRSFNQLDCDGFHIIF